MNKLEANFRYIMWKINWHLEVKKIGDHWEPRGCVRKDGSFRIHRPFWCPLWLKHLVIRLRGYHYSHRSDFTDKTQGLLHGGKGWSEEAFIGLIKNIDEHENLEG